MTHLPTDSVTRCIWCNKDQAGRKSSWLQFLWALLIVAAFGPLALLFYSWKATAAQILLAALSIVLLIPMAAIPLLHPAMLLIWLFGIWVAGCCTYPRTPPLQS